MKKTILISLIFSLVFLFAAIQVQGLAIYEFSCNNTINALGSSVLCQVNVSDYGAAIDYFTRANITLPNGTIENQTPINGSPITLPTANNTIFNVTFTNTRVLGVYNISWFVSNVTDTNVTNALFNVTDTIVPQVFNNLSANPNVTAPVNDSVLDHKTTINISVNVTDDADEYDANIGVDLVLANISYPNASTKLVTLTNSTNEAYSGSFQFESSAPLGRYNMTIFANDSSNNINNSAFFTFFNLTDVTPPAVSTLTAFRSSGSGSIIVGDTVIITAVVADNLPDNVSQVFLNITGLANGSTSNLTKMTNTTATNITSPIYQATFAASIDASGTYTYYIFANDTSNNKNGSIFSTFTVSAAPATVSGGGGGGGGGGFGTQSSLTKDSISSDKSTVVKLRTGSTFNFIVNGQQHKIYLVKREKESITLTIRSTPQTVQLMLGESKAVDTDENGMNDVLIKYLSATSTYSIVEVTKIEEITATPVPSAMPVPQPAKQTAPAETPVVQKTETAQPAPAPKMPAESPISTTTVVIILVIIAAVAIWYYYKKK